MKKVLSILALVATIFSVSCTTGEDVDLTEKLEKSSETIAMLEEEKKEYTATINELTTEISRMETEYNKEMEALDVEKKEALSQVAELLEQINDIEQMDTDEVPSISGPIVGASLLSEASQIVALMSAENYADLSAYVDPVEGIRISPYQYVDTTNDIVLMASEVAVWDTLPLMTWGTYDGSGEPIELTGYDYFHQFVYGADFNSAPYIGQNTVLSTGNMINSIMSTYPGASFVEFYYDGFDPIYEGMDWQSLTVVMKDIGGQWYLVGIVHGQWTI